MGVEFNDAPLDFAALFGREAPSPSKLAFGMGASLVTMAKAKPEQNFLGIEVTFPGVGARLASAEEEGVQNLRVMCHDAVEVLHTMIPDNSLNMVQLFSLTRGTKRAIINVVSFSRLCRAGENQTRRRLPYGDRLGTLCRPYAGSDVLAGRIP